MAKGTLIRKLPWDDASTPKRQARQPIFIPTGIDPNQNPETINWAVANKYASWGVRPGNNFTLVNYQVLQPGTTDKYMSISSANDLVIYGDQAATNAIFVQYNIAHGGIVDVYSIGSSPTFLDNAIVIVAEAVSSFATGGASAVLIAGAQGTFEADSGLESWGSAVGKVGVAYASMGNAGTIGTADTAATTATSATTVGGSMDWDYDYGEAMGNIDYSSGESLTAFTDAENVDFGFGTIDATGNFSTDELGFDGAEGAFSVDDASGVTIDYGATPEPSTGFGTDPNDGTFTSDNALYKDAVKAIPVASKLAQGAKPASTATAPSGSGTKYSQTSTSTIAALLAKASAPSQGSSPSTNQGNGIMDQVESLLHIGTTGQLKPNIGVGTGTSGQMAGTSIYLVIGLCLIGAALIYKAQ